MPAHLPAHVPTQPLDALGGPTRHWLLAEADRLLDGAAGARVAGGGFGWLDGDGRLDPRRGRPLWITARMTHCFALGLLLGRPGDAALVDHGVTSLRGLYRDVEYGGWQADPDRPRTAAPGSRKGAYAHAFVVLAGASAVAAGRPGGRDLLDEALAVSERYFWDEAAGAVVEEWDRGFTVLDPYRGANANMHTVEAYLAAAAVTGERLWRDRALRIATRIVDRGARAHDWRVPEHFDAGWSELPEHHRDVPDHPFRPYGVTPGHGLEWARLLLHLEASLPTDDVRDGAAPDGPGAWLRPAAIGLFDRALADGWDEEHGGICYTTGWDGVPVVRRRFHWVLCEGLAAAALLHRVSGHERFARWYRRMWDDARAHFLDERPGWQMEVDRHGAPSSLTWQGRPDTYHALQLCLVPLLPLAPALAPTLTPGR